MAQAKLIKPNLRNLILQNLVFKLKTIVKNGLHSNHHKADHLQKVLLHQCTAGLKDLEMV